MAGLTKEFNETIKLRAKRDLEFRSAFLAEAINLLLSGDISAGKAVLRNYVNATIGFEALAKETGIPTKSLMRMLSNKGNPTASNLFAIINHLQSATNVHLAVAC